jgi:uncharacterized protein (DUF3084 family)
MRLAESRSRADQPTTAEWQRTVADCERLLRIAEQQADSLASSTRDVSGLSALKMLREDLARREAQVAEREQRVWGWRLVATARDAEVQREVDAIGAREEALRQREAELAQREAQHAEREAELAARRSALEEEHARNTRTLRDEVARLRARVLGVGDGL